MILTFNEIVFNQDYTLVVNKGGEKVELELNVQLTDVEAKEVSQLITANKEEEILKALFKEDLPKIQALLIGPNMTGFTTKVVTDLTNFTLTSIYEVMATKK